MFQFMSFHTKIIRFDKMDGFIRVCRDEFRHLV